MTDAQWMLAELIAFLAVSLVVICTPGPDTALTVRNALAGGRRCGVFTAAGVAVGQAVWTVAASVGIAGLLQASEPAFLAMKIIGAGYLLFLGVQSLRAAWLDRRHDAPARPPALRLGPARAFRQGVINNLANPKMAAFFISLLPQFVPRGAGSLPAYLLLGLLFCTLTFGWLSAYSIAVAKARSLLARPRIRRALDALTGSVLVAFGARLALEQR
jgi:threonine/homoserine/homoserine lactone efflux protein